MPAHEIVTILVPSSQPLKTEELRLLLEMKITHIQKAAFV